MWAMKSIDNCITWELQRDIANYCCLLSNHNNHEMAIEIKNYVQVLIFIFSYTNLHPSD